MLYHFLVSGSFYTKINLSINMSVMYVYTHLTLLEYEMRKLNLYKNFNKSFSISLLFDRSLQVALGVSPVFVYLNY